MKVQLRDLLVAQVTINNLFQERYTLDKLPVKLFYRLQKIIRKLSREAEVFESVRVALIEKYGAVPEEGQPKMVPPANLPAFRGELEKLLEDEVEVDVQLIPKELFESIELPGDAWINLLFLIEGAAAE